MEVIMARALAEWTTEEPRQSRCDGLHREGVGAGQQSIGPGSYKAALPGLEKEELWLAGYGNT